MTRQERFEIEYADQNNMRPEDFAQYRMGETYRLPAIARAHRYFCMGWDAAGEEFPEIEPAYLHEDLSTLSLSELLAPSDFNE